MEEDKSLIEKFKDEMGFKDCSIIEENSFVENWFIGRGKENVRSECVNYKDEDYECGMLIDLKNKRIIKSDCEKIF